MKMNPVCGPTIQAVAIAAIWATTIPVAILRGQDPTRAPSASIADPLTLSEAREAARRVSPELAAAREAMSAAAARERQAGAFPNPTLSYQREQTSGVGQTNSQNIASVDQPIEIGGQRSARRVAARLRRELAEARFAAAQAQIDYDVTRAYALAVAADRHATLARQATDVFVRARNVSQTRLVGGDVSGYAHRRIRLEAARYAGLLAEALLTRHTARLGLASLIASAPDSLGDAEMVLDDSVATVPFVPTADSLRALAARNHPELRAATLEARAAVADARLASRERIPVPIISGGLKNEQVVGGGQFNGFVAGVSLPLPLWDRRSGAIEAANAEARREVAELEVVRRRVAREIGEAAESYRVVGDQLELLRSQLGVESIAALGAAQMAYAEGEISLVEWLDAVRAYQEAESSYATLRAESLIRLAALERAVGTPIPRE